MPGIDRKSRSIAAVALRVAAGVLLIGTGVPKVVDPGHFAAAVEAYRILGHGASAVFAAVVGPLELVCGVLLMLGIWTAAAAIWASVLLGVFCVAQAVVLCRGMNVDCGCFPVAVEVSWGKLMLNIGVMLILVWLSRRELRRLRGPVAALGVLLLFSVSVHAEQPSLLRLEPAVVQVGVVARNTAAQATAEAWNDSDAPLQVTLRPLCGCTKAYMEYPTVPPHGHETIRLIYSPTLATHVGSVTETVVVETRGSAAVKTFLKLHARVFEGDTDFGSVRLGAVVTRSFIIKLSEPAEAKVEAGSHDPQITVERIGAMNPDRGDSRWELQIKLTPSRTGLLEEVLPLMVNGTRYPVPVHAKVTGEFTVTPGTLYFAGMKPGAVAARTARLSESSARPYHVEAVRCTIDGVAAAASALVDGAVEIRATLERDRQPMDAAGYVVVSTDSRVEPEVRIPVRVRYAVNPSK